MNKKEIEEKIKKAEEELKEAREMLAKCEEDKNWKPEYLGEYWSVNSYNEVFCNVWYGDLDETFKYDTGNIFKTEEEAKHRAELLETERQLIKYAREHNDEIDWYNNKYDKWYLIYNFEENDIEIEKSNAWKRARTIYFTSKKLCEQAIESVSEEKVKQYLKEI